MLPKAMPPKECTKKYLFSNHFQNTILTFILIFLKNEIFMEVNQEYLFFVDNSSLSLNGVDI